MLQRQNKLPRVKENQHNISIKTVKTLSQYNITDFLPPAQDYAQSRTTFNPLRLKDKATTEPVEKLKQPEKDELYKKVVTLEQEKLVLKVELQRAKRELIISQECLREKDNQLRQTMQQRQEYSNKLRQLQQTKVPRISLQKNTLQFQMFPKFKQAYQVSVQTDPAIEQHSLSKQIKTMPSVSSDMQHIYQKMENLKMGKRSAKPQVANLQPNFTSNFKAERPRAFTSNWGSYDKQNLMRNSNLMEKKQTQKLQKVRDETLEVFLMPLQQGQKLLSAYIDDSYL